MLEIETVFQRADEHPAKMMYEGSIFNALKRAFPNPLFLDELDEKWIEANLPLLKWVKWEGKLSLFLLSHHRPNLGRFFHDMVARLLIPGRRLEVGFFFTADFRLPRIGDQLLTMAEMVVGVEDEWDWEHNLKIIETEIRLGMVSVYHASRILEVRGIEKSALIQEKITYLLQRWPDQIDYDIFGEMQHFLVLSKEEFRQSREVHHQSRLITIFYLLRRHLLSEVEALPEKRHLKMKLSKARVHLPWGMKEVVSIFIGVNFLRGNELFEERHVIKALKTVMPGAKPVADTFFVHEKGDDDQIHILYIEVEKEDGTEFSLQELKHLKQTLPEELKQGIEVVMPPLFMPRNEEEILRDIVALAGQLKFVKDMPQLILIFEEQTETELCFTVIIVRVLLPGLRPIAEFFHHSFLTYLPDRVKRVGMLRNRYPKEATVFRIRFASAPFLRADHSVDLYKARQAVVAEINRLLGDVRDYNGGMIAKQVELFALFVSSLSSYDELLLEKFFYSIYPHEIRTILSVDVLKTWFLLWQEKREGVYVEENLVYFIGHKNFSFGPHQFPEMKLALMKLETEGNTFYGCLYFADGESDRDHFLTLLDVEEAKTIK